MTTFWIIYSIFAFLTFIILFLLGDRFPWIVFKAILWPLHWLIYFIRRGGGY